MAYSLNQEKYFRRFLDDGEIPIDNNAAEQSIRSFCIGKKNWVMCDTINGAKSSAIIYSLVETAKANKLRLYEYFNYLLMLNFLRMLIVFHLVQKPIDRFYSCVSLIIYRIFCKIIFQVHPIFIFIKVTNLFYKFFIAF